MNKKRGISLITLIITIIVIIILAGAIILSLNNTNIIRNANKAVSSQDRENLISIYNMFVLDNLYDESINGNIKNITIDELAEKIGKNSEDFSRFSIDENGNLKEGNEIIVYKTAINGKNSKLKKEMTNNGNLEGEAIMAPKLYGMIPVKVNSKKDNFEDTTENDKDWYKYVSQENDSGLSFWANARTNSGDYFVWIPRYAYKITNEKIKGKIDVIFVDLNDKDKNGNEISKEYIVHPAFNIGNEKLSGIWIGKYESSYIKGKIKIEPNKVSCRNYEIADIFDLCYNMGNDKLNYGFNDELKEGFTHMLKNVEWGAATYLAYSKYRKSW